MFYDDKKQKRTGQTFERRSEIMVWLIEHYTSIGRRTMDDLADWCSREKGFPVTGANVESILKNCKIPTKMIRDELDRLRIKDAVDRAIERMQPLIKVKTNIGGEVPSVINSRRSVAEAFLI